METILKIHLAISLITAVLVFFRTSQAFRVIASRLGLKGNFSAGYLHGAIKTIMYCLIPIFNILLLISYVLYGKKIRDTLIGQYTRIK